MRPSILIASLLAGIAVAVPYTGPCQTTNCGVDRLDCTNKGHLCVAYPDSDPSRRLGCTCSSGVCL
ncbi:hypothetical protein P153DRAFT_389469 [Dothidotthia symphoricarpi CBS 119687]|uniref:Extracellular membrane protein CFEM domain-containing protein n=1 Tax=Dothidotthia symphoricarpi CBS 119687 TaxID=1392245 RepID=A0A6A6A1B2_9PLEO|nr:uncharacterized protein P153DRAFT_389469 [Dothidotthia symphoricarpi CBS 119687]KAF2125306.1 hypothetical protein P153DRAFT_389469 [Dothidotthia symphoricarpi CBS 119687]